MASYGAWNKKFIFSTCVKVGVGYRTDRHHNGKSDPDRQYCIFLPDIPGEARSVILLYGRRFCASRTECSITFYVLERSFMYVTVSF